MEDAIPADASEAPPAIPRRRPTAAPPRRRRRSTPRRSASGALAYAHNEAVQIIRDPIRLAFAFIGSTLLMLVFGFGITTDVEHIRYASLDLDQSPGESDSTSTSSQARRAISTERRRPQSADEALKRLQSDDVSVVLEIPPRLRPRLPPRRGSRGPRASRRRDDVPRRHRRAIRQGRARDRRSAIAAIGLATATCTRRTGRDRRALHVQPDVRERLLDGAERPRAAALAHPRDPHDGRASCARRSSARSSTSTSRRRGGSSTCVGKQLPYVVIAMINFFILTGDRRSSSSASPSKAAS